MSSSAIAPTTAWSQVRVPTSRPGLTRVEFHFSPAYLGTFCSHDSAFPTRDLAPTREREKILLDDIVKLDGGYLYVWAWLVPSGKQDGIYHIRAKISAPRGIRQNVKAVLSWADGEVELPLPAGRANYEEITNGNYSLHYDNLPTSKLCIRIEHDGKKLRG